MRVCWCVGTRDMSRVKVKVISWWALALFFHQVCLGRLNSTFTCQTILLAVFVDSRQSLLCSLWLALNLGSHLLTLLSAGFPGLCHHAQFVCLYVCGCVVCVCRGRWNTGSHICWQVLYHRGTRHTPSPSKCYRMADSMLSYLSSPKLLLYLSHFYCR